MLRLWTEAYQKKRTKARTEVYRSTDRSTASVPKHGSKHRPCRSIPKQCFDISYSMSLNRGHRIANTEALLWLSATEALLRYHDVLRYALVRGLANPNPNPNVNPNPKTKHRPKHVPKHCFGTEARTEAQTMFRSIPKQCFGISILCR